MLCAGFCLCWKKRFIVLIHPSGVKTSWFVYQVDRFPQVISNVRVHFVQLYVSHGYINRRFSSLIGAVISAPPVTRPLYYSSSPAPVELVGGGSVSPARKTGSALEPNPGINLFYDILFSTFAIYVVLMMNLIIVQKLFLFFLRIILLLSKYASN